MVEIGDILAGVYKIIETPKVKGGMSKTFLAKDNELNRVVFVKVINKNDSAKITEARKEAKMLNPLSHNGLVAVYRLIENASPDEIAIIMEYVDGKSLLEVVNERFKNDKIKGLPEEQVINIAKQLCKILKYLHSLEKPIIYVDLKPENIMLNNNGQIKVIDFGSACEYTENPPTKVYGTKQYAAPEQGKYISSRTDIYNFGATIFALITGKIPVKMNTHIKTSNMFLNADTIADGEINFNEDDLQSVREINPEISHGLDYIIRKCTKFDPKNRYQNCSELLNDLELWPNIGPITHKKERKKLNFFILTVVIMFAFFGMGIFSNTQRTQTVNADYENLCLLAEKSVDDNEKVRLYLSAIDKKPTDAKAYSGLIAAFKADGDFTVEEASLLDGKNTKLNQFRSSPDYPEIAFEIGKLYWYYYSYGNAADNRTTRTVKSIPWFEDVVSLSEQNNDNARMAQVYRDIGEFDRAITQNIVEGSENSLFQPYFSNIEVLLESIKNNPNDAEIVKLEIYTLAANALENYARKFKSNGVSEEEVITAFNNIKQGIDETDVTSDKTAEMKTKIQERIPEIEETLENAYFV